MKNFTHGYALLIGVGESAYTPLSLPVTVNDTQAIYAALIDQELCGYAENNIKVLNNRDATKANILAGLDWLRLQAKKDTEATIFIYYSGHGWVNKTDNNYYLLQHDIEPTELASSALSAKDFTEGLRRIKAERLLVVIDSCHVAGMATSKSVEEADAELLEEFDDFQRITPSKGLISEWKQGKGRVVFTSSEGKQKSQKLRIKNNNSIISIYTFHFLEALQGAGNRPGDTEVKVSNLMNYLGKTVPKTVQDLYSEEQDPRFDLDTNDFAIANLRGGKGLPDKGWDEVKQEASQKINKIADVIHHSVGIISSYDGHSFYIGDNTNGSTSKSVDLGTKQIYAETRSEINRYVDEKPYQSSHLQLLRYPNIDCPDKVILNERFSVTIELLLDKPELQYGSAFFIEDTGDDLPNVEVVLSHQGFDIKGSNTKIMEIKRDGDSHVRFVLISRNIGQKKIKASFYQNGKPIGKAVRNILVSEQPLSVDVSQPDELGEMELKTVLTIPPQDLELYIDLADDNRTLSFGLHSVKENINYHRKKLGQVILKGSPIEKIQSIYKEVILLARRMPTSAEDKAWAEHRLESIGNQLWDELIPEQLKQEYWKFKSRVTSVLITSEEPWIPWEMIKPYRYNDDGEEENSLFWCQQFAMSRWLSSECGTADNLDIKTGRSIVPIESNLPAVKDEIALLEKLSDLRANFTPLTTFNYREQVLDSLKNEDLSIFHFACHGIFDSNSPNNSAIKLSGGPLCPSDIRVSFGGKRQRPLIFINACHSSQAEFSFTGLGGWAKRMVEAKVGVFIGSMWEVNDKLAVEFAKTFYTALLQEDKTFAESFRQAREKIRQLAPYNSTWLAYTLYADPEGKVT